MLEEGSIRPRHGTSEANVGDEEQTHGWVNADWGLAKSLPNCTRPGLL